MSGIDLNSWTQRLFPPELSCETESQEELKSNRGKIVKIVIVQVRKFSFEDAAAKLLYLLRKYCRTGAEAQTCPCVCASASVGQEEPLAPRSPREWMVTHSVLSPFGTKSCVGALKAEETLKGMKNVGFEILTWYVCGSLAAIRRRAAPCGT